MILPLGGLFVNGTEAEYSIDVRFDCIRNSPIGVILELIILLGQMDAASLCVIHSTSDAIFPLETRILFKVLFADHIRR